MPNLYAKLIAAGDDVHRLHRHDAALLPLAGDAADRPVRPQQRRPAQLLPRSEAASRTSCPPGCSARATTPPTSASSSTRTSRTRAEPAAVAPGWDLWFTQLEKRRYYNWKASKNGKVRRYGNGDNDHATDRHQPSSRRAGRSASPARRTPSTCRSTTTRRTRRRGATPAARPARFPRPMDEGRFAVVRAAPPPNFNEEDVSDKPASIRDRTAAHRRRGPESIERRYRCTLESVYGVDRGIGEIIPRGRGRAASSDDTVFVFTSDNGYFYGEHRIPKGKPQPLRGEPAHAADDATSRRSFRDGAELIADHERADGQHRHRADACSTSPTPSRAGPSGSAGPWTAARCCR